MLNSGSAVFSGNGSVASEAVVKYDRFDPSFLSFYDSFSFWVKLFSARCLFSMLVVWQDKSLFIGRMVTEETASPMVGRNVPKNLQLLVAIVVLTTLTLGIII